MAAALFFPEVKLPMSGVGVNHYPSVAKVKNEWGSSTSSHVPSRRGQEKRRLYLFLPYYLTCMGTAVAQWLRRCATNQKVAVSIPDGAFLIFH